VQTAKMYGRTRQQTAARRKEFKKAIDPEDSRRKREEHSVRIRRNKREEHLLKRRNISRAPGDHSSLGVEQSAENLAGLPQLINDIKGDNPAAQLEAVIRVRKLLSIERNPPIAPIIKSGVVPRLVQFLESDNYQLQFESAWALTNIASGSSDQTRAVIESNAVPRFVALLGSQNDDVREQAVWALGNIAGDSTNCRDFVLAHGGMRALLNCLGGLPRTSMLRNATWTLSNLCRGKPQPRWELVNPSLTKLASLIQAMDEEVLTDACWALSYLSDGPNDHIQDVIDAGVVPRMVKLLMHPSWTVQTPALRTVGNIVTGTDQQTQKVIECGALPSLLILLSSAKKGIRKEACWAISNITAGKEEQIQSVIDAGIIPPLIQLLQHAEFDIKKEAAWAISNTTSGGTPEQIRYLVQQNAIKPLCDLLEYPDARIILVALEGIENILKAGEKDSKTGEEYTLQVDECNGIDKMEGLQNHENNDIYEKAVSILETYFHAEEDENTAPHLNEGGNAFQFGAPSQSTTFQF